ncbi:hypothetical protein RB200_17675 [Streptomyces sp. PmtG]
MAKNKNRKQGGQQQRAAGAAGLGAGPVVRDGGRGEVRRRGEPG